MASIERITTRDDAKKYLAEKEIPRLLESMMTGLMYQRPEDPLAYLEECIIKSKQTGVDNLSWDTFALKKDVLPPLSEVPPTYITEAEQDDINPYPTLPPITQRTVEPSMLDSETELAKNVKIPAKFIIIMSEPGCLSSKGHYISNICKQYSYFHIALGHLIQKEMEAQSKLSDHLAFILKEKKEVPSAIICKLIQMEVLAHSSYPGFVVEGFPRSSFEADVFEKHIGSVKVLIHLKSADSNQNIERSVIDGYNKIAKDVIQFYSQKSNVVEIDSIGSESQVFNKISSSLKDYIGTTSQQEVIEDQITYSQQSESLGLSDESLPPQNHIPVVEEEEIFPKEDIVLGLDERTHGSKSKKSIQAPVFFILGGPGSGKGTQCAKIVQKYHFVHLSSGDLLRAEVEKGTERGQQLENIMKAGDLVPMETVLDLIHDAMLSNEDCPGFVIDGYPRELEQGVQFEKQVAPCSACIYFELSDDVMTQRLLKRGETSGRADDNEETIKKRLETFHNATEPVIAYYKDKGILHTISAERSIDDIFNDVIQKFSSLNIVNEEEIVPEEESLLGLDDRTLPPEKAIKAPVFFILGGPGSGKGTQCEKIVERYNFAHLSSGDLLRAEVEKASERGQQLETIMKAGDLVPIETVLELLHNAMLSKGDCPGFVIDGYPRELEQGVQFENKVAPCSACIYFELSDDIMTERLLKRGETSGRADDNEETIKKRLDTFHKATEPVIAYYKDKGILHTISAERSIDDIFNDVVQKFSSLNIGSSTE